MIAIKKHINHRPKIYINPIHSRLDELLTNEDIRFLVVSDEMGWVYNENFVKEINLFREEHGMGKILLTQIPCVIDNNGKRISSTRIRNGEKI